MNFDELNQDVAPLFAKRGTSQWEQAREDILVLSEPVIRIVSGKLFDAAGGGGRNDGVLDQDDLTQHCRLVVWQVTEKWDADRGASWSSFIYGCCHRRLSTVVNSNGIGIHIENPRKARLEGTHPLPPMRLDMTFDDGEDTLGSTLADATSPLPSDAMEAMDDLAHLRARLAGLELSPMERACVDQWLMGKDYAGIALAIGLKDGWKSIRCVDSTLLRVRRKARGLPHRPRTRLQRLKLEKETKRETAIKLRSTGLSYKEIAKAIGSTTQSCRQMCLTGKPATRKATILRAIRAGKTIPEAAHMARTTVGVVRTYVWNERKRLGLAGKTTATKEPLRHAVPKLPKSFQEDAHGNDETKVAQ